MPDELANGDVRTKSDPVALRQGRQSPRVVFRCSLTRLPTDSPSMGILWARLEAGLNKKVEMALPALMQVGQKPLRLIYVFLPWLLLDAGRL